jgi:hypothetical protein
LIVSMSWQRVSSDEQRIMSGLTLS